MFQVIKMAKCLWKREDFYTRHYFAIDTTELTGLDDLHVPEGPIREAELLLANLHKVQKSYFLVNGSTTGNLAMIMAGMWRRGYSVSPA